MFFKSHGLLPVTESSGMTPRMAGGLSTAKKTNTGKNRWKTLWVHVLDTMFFAGNE